MNDPVIAGPVQWRGPNRLESICDENSGHRHHYDHTTIITAGKVRVEFRITRNGEEVEEAREFSKGQYFVARAELYHKIIALSPKSEWYCIFSHRDFDGVVVQEYGPHVSPKSSEALPDEETVGENIMSQIAERAGD